MPRESVLTAVERNQIRIEKLIFHIILKDEMQPRYLNEVTITDEQRSFFRDRLEDAASGRQFLFLDDSATKMKSEELVDCDDARFVQLSKELAADFRSHHGASTNNGVFIVLRAGRHHDARQRDEANAYYGQFFPYHLLICL